MTIFNIVYKFWCGYYYFMTNTYPRYSLGPLKIVTFKLRIGTVQIGLWANLFNDFFLEMFQFVQMNVFI